MTIKSFDNLSIHFKVFNQSRKNEKKNIFLLHGWTANSTFYYFLTKYFQDWNLILWDARCHGRSEIDKNATIEKMAQDLKYFLEFLGLEDVTVIGHSMGALTLFEYICNFGAKMIDRIVIIDQSPKLITDNSWRLGLYGNFSEIDNLSLIKEFENDLSLGILKLSYKYGINREYNKLYEEKFDYLYSNRRIFTKEQSEGLINIWKSFSVKDYRNVLDKINIPVLLIYGGKSQFYKRETGVYLREKIKNSSLIIFEDGDHSPFLADPIKFSNAVYDFVKGEGPFLDKNIYGRV